MNLDSLSFALAEISYSVANLTKKNFKANVSEISHLVAQHGAEADRHLFRCLFSHVDFSGDGKSSGKDFHQFPFQTQFLIQECGSLFSKSNFVSTLCYAIDNPLHHQKSLKPTSQLFPQLSKVLRLSRVQEVVFGLALLNSVSPDSRTYATQYIKQKLPDLLRSYVDADVTSRQEGGLQDVCIEVLHLLLTHLERGKDHFGIGNEQKEAFLKTLRRDFPRERAPAVLAPLLFPSTEDIPIEKLADTHSMPKSMMDASLADMILEAGYSCTSTVEECRNHLMQFGFRELTPTSVARVLGMMAHTPTGLGESQPAPTSVAVGSGWSDKDRIDTPGVTTWNVEIFVQVVKDLAPLLNWKEVVSQLDHKGFYVNNKKGLKLLMEGLFRGLQDIFPVEYIFKPWSNTEGQLSYIIQSLRNPDVFSFADYPGDTVVIDILKSTPNDEDREVATWKSLNLVESLLRLAEAGHYQAVWDLFKYPSQKCPDMLVLALLQTTPTWNTIKQELIATLMPIFLGSHANSAVVLHYAWHHQGHSSTIRTLIMHSMAEWYMRGEPHDQTRLSRILDVAQDLKALSMLLNATPFAFVIDLACLASRREYLKLDKWLTDKIGEHKMVSFQEPFIQACVTFLKRRCPQLVGAPVKEELPQMKSQQLPPDTIATMLTCLKTWANQVSQELSESIATMFTNASLILNRNRQAPPGVVGPKQPQQQPPTNFPPSGMVNPMDPLANIGNVLAPPTQSAVGSGASSAFPTSGITSAFPTTGASSAFPSSGSTAFPSTGLSAGFPTSVGSSVFPTSVGSSAFPTSVGSSAFPTSVGSSAFPTSVGSSAFPTSVGSSAFPTSVGSSAFPTSGGSSAFPTSVGSSAFPSSVGSSAFPTSVGSSVFPSSGSTPFPSSGSTPFPSSGSTPFPSSGSTPFPSSGSTPFPSSGSTPFPSSGSTPFPSSGSTPFPSSGSTPFPSSGSTPFPSSGSTPFPSSGSTPFPSSGSTPFPSGSTPFPSGSTPFPAGGSSGFPQSLAGSVAPGSPSKGFSGISQQNNTAFNPIQSLSSQFQNLGFQTPISTAMGPPRNPVNSLANLSAQVAVKQGASSADRISTRPTGTGPPGDMSTIFPEMTQQFSKEVEDKANSYFQQIYNQPPHPTMSIDEVLEMLKRFKDSQNKIERDVFACMLRNLFEEYRFFPQYPERELHTTAVLFGGIIEQGIVTYWTLGIALRYILEALRKPYGSKMYYFGIAALDRFKTRLKDYPQYCQHLAAIQHFQQFPQHLIEFVDFGARSLEPPPMAQTSGTLTPTMGGTPVPVQPANNPVARTTEGAVSGGGAATAVVTSAGAGSGTTTVNTTSTRPTPGPAFSKPSIATATNIDTLLAGQGKEEIAVPPESLQDKVFFIFNNLSLANMQPKGEELKEQVGEEYMPWCSQYLVMKRASIEPNFHTLYSSFIDVLQIPNMTQTVIKETFRNIKVLLRSDKGVANFSDRTLLKNLGHWLGMLTLGKNKPILQIDIDVKALLYEAYQKGAQELLYVVPFSAKVLESCSKSKVFRPPNPWTMAIMNVLAELHMEPDLKLNLKFEIEVLCKTLGLDINELKPTNYLKDPMRLPTIECQLSAPKPQIGTPLPPAEESVVPSLTSMSIPPPIVTSVTTMSTPTSTAPVSTPNLPPQPTYSFHDVNASSFTGLAQHIIINDQIALLHQNPQLKQYVRPAIERSVQELLPPVVERSIKIALTTCEQIVRKDFALDPEEMRMRSAAHYMVRNITAGLALITCREPLFISINNNLKNAFMATLRGATQAQKTLIEEAATLVAQDNAELACAFIQKTAVERAIPEMDKRLATEFDLRKHARSEGRRYCDPIVLPYQAERMPDQIRLKVGGVTPQQIAVYDEFARNIPGFLPLTDATFPPGISKPTPSYAPDEITMIYEKIARDIEQHLQQMMGIPAGSPMGSQLHSLLEAVLLARNSREIVTAIALLQKAVEGLLDQYSMNSLTNTDQEMLLRFRECHLVVLKGLQDARAYGPQWVNKEVTRCLIQCRDEFKYNIDAVDCLIRSGLVNLQQYDVYLSQLMENGLNHVAVSFSMQLVQRFCIDDKHNSSVSEADFYNTIEALGAIASRSRQHPEGLSTLIEIIRQNSDGGLLDRTPGGPTSMMQSGISQAREFDDPPGLNEKTEYLLREWVNMYHSPAAGRDSTKAFSAFVQQMHQQGILKTDDLITRFFRLCTEMCVDLCYRALSEQTHTSPTLIRAKCFHTLDAFVRLIALLVKHSGDTTNTVTKINLLNKVLGIVAGVLLQDHEVRYTEFQQLPYHRIFIMLFIELNAPEPILESINFQVLAAFCHVFHILRPGKAPGFAYAWLELVSHRVFIGRLLALTPQQRGWGMYAQLLIDLFRFLSPFLRNAELTKPTQLLYRGTLRVLLVLLHDFPEFLCDYHYAFCDVIPPNCIQMRNLILSAFPRNMRLPDPFTPNLKVDTLPDITHPPRILTNFVNMIQPASFKKDLDSYLKTRTPISFLSELRSSLQSNEPGCHYNIPLINALVLYVGTQAIQFIHTKGQTPAISTIAPSSHMDIFQNLAVNLDTEGRYLFLTAIANQLRYPNSHTHYFSCTLLYLFVQANNEQIQEQITRVLLERLIVNRPHPWGLLITFIELIKNSTFKFWSHEFVHCAPEIDKLFESVARSCMQPKQTGNSREPETAEVH
ncbi:CCR4-NOT transcription complex subunit 1-like isoform X5 [Haliotis rufescens]|uniref:CCR4-NOT transcription complex subunit 1-like isoform X5 n=1 Tax=Haliotis rufescens TaxID=6454 RepID=UPI00201EDA31|nr:CCR4-NOT transcription complex subunit 1-like isoform X5 [Haliotis rufescens]